MLSKDDCIKLARDAAKVSESTPARILEPKQTKLAVRGHERDALPADSVDVEFSVQTERGVRPRIVEIRRGRVRSVVELAG